MKKLLAVILAIVMICSLSISAFADGTDPDPITIGVATTDTHTYAVYQIFTADLAEENGKMILSNVKWGENGTGTTGELVDKTTVLAALADEELAVAADQIQLDEILKYVTLSNPIGTVKAGSPLEVVNGYYILKDLGVAKEDGSYYLPEGQEYSLYITEVVDSVVITPKRDQTSTLKKVDDKNDSTGEEDEINWVDGADHDIGDAIDFKLEAHITGNYDNFEYYYFAFHDTQSKGLTFNNDVVVTVDGYKIDPKYYSVVTTGLTSPETFQIVFEDLKNIEYTIPATETSAAITGNKVVAGSTIIATYTSTLNKDAVIGEPGNPNEMYGEYSRNPNDYTDHGNTPKDKVVVFTYELDANKVEKNPAYDSTVQGSKEYIALKGAGFTLYKKTGMTTPTEEGEEPEAIWTAVGNEVSGTDMTTFTWPGVDDGDYKLEETTTPQGYNTMAPIFFTISAEVETKSDDPQLISLSTDVRFPTQNTTDEDDNIKGLEGQIINEKGTVLPETGGIGTTIFYVLGGVLLVGAAVLLITKKRMGAKG